MSIETDWVIISGPPSSGKTTLLGLFAEDGENTIPDAVRAMITRVVATGRDAEEFRFSDDFQPMAIAAITIPNARWTPLTDMCSSMDHPATSRFIGRRADRFHRS
ncbi:MAG: hypothetical protein EX269_09020 [Acidimicrobiales bacterium]|nr:MAG: hypothetical protein EX269_09020 [Acidimicrobiales bacterium]